MKNIFQHSLVILSTVLLLQACKPDLDEAASAGSADFSRYISVGNSLTAGFADGGLYLEGQKVAYPNLIAGQLNQLSSDEFNTPYFSEAQKNGSGYRILRGFTALGTPNIGLETSSLAYDGRTATLPPPIGRVTYLAKYAGGDIDNYGVPGIRLSDVLTAGYGLANPYYERMLSGTDPQTKPYLRFVTENPFTFFSCWLGNNDVLGYATSGGIVPLTPAPAFTVLYDSVMVNLTKTGAKGVVATIPDVTSVPFFTAIPSATLISLAQSVTSPVPNTVVVAGYKTADGTIKELKTTDYICLTADSLGVANASGAVKGAVIKAPNGAILGGYPLNNEDVLDADEAKSAQDAISAYNQIIQAAASKYQLALVDANGFLKSVKTGYVVDGTSVNASFISGGIFSLDGIHLTPRGNAIAANEFIKAINKKYNSKIPTVSVAKYSGVKFP
jgi:hypothetical protein